MFSKVYRTHYKANFYLAFPVMLGQVGHMFTSIADNIMVGQVSSLNLAASSFANNVFAIFLLFSIGLSSAITPLTSNANGRRDIAECKSFYKNGIAMSWIVGISVTLLMLLVSLIFPYLGQSQQVLDLATPYYYQLCFCILPTAFFLNIKHFIEGLSLTKPAMAVSVACNLLNIILNYLFIYGKFGFPAMGLLGAGWATLISRIAMPIILLIYVRNSANTRIYFDLQRKIKFSIKKMKALFQLGIPIGMQYILEVGAFTAGMLVVGQMGSSELAAHQIALSITSLTYLVASGIASGATIRLSFFSGKRDVKSLKLAGKTSFIQVWGFMAICAVLLFIAHNLIPSLYVKEQRVIEIASNLLIICALYQIFDGTQVMAMGVLRGLQDVKIPTFIALFSYWGICLPMCYVLGIVYNFGVNGVWIAFLIGLAVAAILLYLRYLQLVNKMKPLNLTNI